MSELVEKIKDFEYWLESIAITLIVMGLVILLVKTVLPNMGLKALPVSWMAALGSTVILSYSVFYELKSETIKRTICTRVVYTEEGELINPYVDVKSINGRHELDNEVREGNIVLKPVDISDLSTSGAPVELVVLNIIDFLTSDLKDWKAETVTTSLNVQISYRKPNGLKRDKTFYRHKVLSHVPFESISMNYEEYEYSEIDGGYSIWPSSTEITASKDTVKVVNPHFVLNIKVISGNSFQQVNKYLEIDKTNLGDKFYLTSQQVSVGYTLTKSRAGSPKRSEYKSFCETLCEGLSQRLRAKEAV